MKNTTRDLNGVSKNHFIFALALVFLVVSPISVFSASPALGQKAAPVPEQKPKLDCVDFSKTCSACSDGTLRVPQTNVVKKTTDFECATSSMPAKDKAQFIAQKKCYKLSSFCKICGDGTFRTVDSGKKFTSDLYECSTRPRSKIYGEISK